MTDNSQTDFPSRNQCGRSPTKRNVKHKHFESLVVSSNRLNTLLDKHRDSAKNVVDYYMMNSIEQEINEAVQNFQAERNKQNGALNAMRDELKHQRIKSVLDESKSLLNLETETLQKLKKYKQRAKELEVELIQERAESSRLKKLLSNYESENANLRDNNEELRRLLADFEELKADSISAKDLIEKKDDSLHEGKQVLSEEEEYKDGIKKLLKEGAFEYDCLNDEYHGVESAKELIEKINKYVSCLINDKKGSEAKYVKLLELYNKLIEVNSKGTKKYNETALIEENNRLKLKLEKNRISKQ
eukprot:TRINITY_DN11336_c0_g1_i2.p1 TRINITY_DN11336_c0_g1~~TRINITY_DN11336_c0_g1_i2.p1  ORF type:complete len:338 (+),score=77.39 TRINITY_DN11336_c0_g1_i2:110-1015(+)